MTIGLFIGRFQPFHNGHLHVVKQILEECGEVKIGIGSANTEITEKDPLSTAKRKEMIEKVMLAENIINYKIVLINDQETHQLWADEVRKKAEPFDVVYVSGNNVRLDFIKACGFEVKEIDFIDGVSATKIRELKKNGEPWQHLVPTSIVQDFS
jgi:nicotinamide-nucleotide adenylyltransferase